MERTYNCQIVPKCKHCHIVAVMLSNLHIGQVIKSVYPINSDYTIMDIDYGKGKLLMKQNNIGYTRWIDAQELVANY